MGDVFFLGVEVVYDCGCVICVAGCEDHYFKIFTQLFQALSRIRPNINPYKNFLLIRKQHRQTHISFPHPLTLHTMYQRLIKIKNNSIFLAPTNFRQTLSRDLP